MGQTLTSFVQRLCHAARTTREGLLGVKAAQALDDECSAVKGAQLYHVKATHVISTAHSHLSEGLTPAGNPLPAVVHARLTTESSRGGLNPKGRLIVVGDVHGCVGELRALLEGLSYRPGVDVAVLAGDLVTKGPESQQVLQLALAWGLRCVRGNHDDAALAAYYAWQRGEAIEPRFDFVKTLAAEEVEYLHEMPFTLSLPEYGVDIVHAGLVPGIPLHKQSLYDVYTMRLLFHREDGIWVPYDGQTPTPLGAMPWATCWPGPCHVCFGHDHPRGLQLAAYATGVDTGCWAGGALTAAVLPSLKELRQSKVFRYKLKAREPLTLDDLQGRIVSVPSSLQR